MHRKSNGVPSIVVLVLSFSLPILVVASPPASKLSQPLKIETGATGQAIASPFGLFATPNVSCANLTDLSFTELHLRIVVPAQPIGLCVNQGCACQGCSLQMATGGVGHPLQVVFAMSIAPRGFA